MSGLVSIITPSYNSAIFIKESIDSVIGQTYTNWEMIIVDDCSLDNSNAIIEGYIKKDNRIKLIKLDENSGPAVSRNRAIKEAKGRYIAFLDSDDFWDKYKLTRQLGFMNEKSVAFCFTAYYRIKEDTGKTIDYQTVPDKVDYATLLKQCVIGCLTVVYDTDKLGKIYMPHIIKRQDYALWLKILKQIPYAYGIDEPLAYYRVRISSVSSNKLTASKYHWKVLREIEKLPLYKAMYYFTWYTYKSILKYSKPNKRIK